MRGKGGHCTAMSGLFLCQDQPLNAAGDTDSEDSLQEQPTTQADVTRKTFTLLYNTLNTFINVFYLFSLLESFWVLGTLAAYVDGLLLSSIKVSKTSV